MVNRVAQADCDIVRRCCLPASSHSLVQLLESGLEDLPRSPLRTMPSNALLMRSGIRASPLTGWACRDHVACSSDKSLDRATEKRKTLESDSNKALPILL